MQTCVMLQICINPCCCSLGVPTQFLRALTFPLKSPEEETWEKLWDHERKVTFPYALCWRKDSSLLPQQGYGDQ